MRRISGIFYCLIPVLSLIFTTSLADLNDFQVNTWTENSIENILHHFRDAVECQEPDECFKVSARLGLSSNMAEWLLFGLCAVFLG